MFVKAQNYMKKKEMFKDQPDKLPERDLKLESLEMLLRGIIPARAHAHIADDILTAISISEEFGFNIVLDHTTEGHRIANILAERKIPVVIGPLLTAKRKVELRNRTTEAPGVLARAGVKFSITTDHPVIPIKLLPLEVAVVIRDGLPFEEALKSVTINAAKILGVDDRVGSIEIGKDGDLVILSGRPFDIETKVLYTIVNGKIVYSSEEVRRILR